MKTRLVLLEIPEECELCCEDCTLFDGEDMEECTGPVIKGKATEFSHNLCLKCIQTNGVNDEIKLYAVKN